MKFRLSLLAGLLCAGFALQADVLVPKQGNKNLTGHTLEIDGQIIFTSSNGDVRILNKANYKEIIPTAKLQEEYKEKIKSAKDAAALFALADWARDNGLDEEKRAALLAVLKLDSANDRAAQALGFVKKDGKWTNPLDDKTKSEAGYTVYNNNRWVLDVSQKDKWKFTPEEINTHSDYKNAWEILSEHYLLKTNLPPLDALKMIGQLEEVYAQFKKEFGDQAFATVPTSLIVNLYAKKKEYENYAVGRWGRAAIGTTGFFLYQERCITTFVQPNLETQFMHEGFHQLLYHCLGITNFTPTSTWIHEGIGRFFEGSTWKDNKIEKCGGYVGNAYNIIQQSLARKQYPPLKDLVPKTFTEQRFGQFFDVCYAFSAAYIDFMLHYENGKYRQGLVKYFNVVRARGESIESFEKAFGVKIDVMQAEWEKWMAEKLAKEMGGAVKKDAENKAKAPENAKAPEDKKDAEPVNKKADAPGDK